MINNWNLSLDHPTRHSTRYCEETNVPDVGSLLYLPTCSVPSSLSPHTIPYYTTTSYYIDSTLPCFTLRRTRRAAIQSFPQSQPYALFLHAPLLSHYSASSLRQLTNSPFSPPTRLSNQVSNFGHRLLVAACAFCFHSFLGDDYTAATLAASLLASTASIHSPLHSLVAACASLSCPTTASSCVPRTLDHARIHITRPTTNGFSRHRVDFPPITVHQAQRVDSLSVGDCATCV